MSATLPSSTADIALSEMLHVLDVARALRDEKQVVESELNKEELYAALRERLLAAAAAAGDNVTQAEVDAAIDIYFDNLHKYADPPLGCSVLLAYAYVLRRSLATGLGALALFLLVCWGMFWRAEAPLSAESRQRRAEERDLQAVTQREQAVDDVINDYRNQLAAARAIAEDPAAVEQLSRLGREGDAVVHSRSSAEIQRLTREIAVIDQQLRQEFEILIVPGLDSYSAVIRDYHDDQSGTVLSGYYVLVEAHTPDGQRLSMDITSREDQQTRRVTVWGEQVPEAVYERVGQDKQSDGVLDDRRFAVKRRGWLDLEMVLEGADGQPLDRQGQITEW